MHAMSSDSINLFYVNIAAITQSHTLACLRRGSNVQAHHQLVQVQEEKQFDHSCMVIVIQLSLCLSKSLS